MTIDAAFGESADTSNDNSLPTIGLFFAAVQIELTSVQQSARRRSPPGKRHTSPRVSKGGVGTYPSMWLSAPTDT